MEYFVVDLLAKTKQVCVKKNIKHWRFVHIIHRKIASNEAYTYKVILRDTETTTSSLFVKFCICVLVSSL